MTRGKEYFGAWLSPERKNKIKAIAQALDHGMTTVLCNWIDQEYERVVVNGQGTPTAIAPELNCRKGP